MSTPGPRLKRRAIKAIAADLGYHDVLASGPGIWAAVLVLDEIIKPGAAVPISVARRRRPP